MTRLPLSAVRAGSLSVAALHGAEVALQVRVSTGIVQGKQQDGVRTFLGIPYAAPPVGDLRWKPPVPAAKWDGVRQATEFGPRPIQPVIYSDMVFRDPGGSEDCLTLNVWTPAKDAGPRLPVLVWIYGGGFVAGGSSEQRQDGSNLAARGVVVVSMNYRLGIFGFLVHPDLVRESPHHAAGSYGLMDQMAALQWVRDNIAGFGGDPANVTIFGESAGSASVCAQMASPLANGLFHRAIGESGALHFIAGSSGQSSLEASSAKDAAFMRERTGAGTLKELRALSAESLVNVTTHRSAAAGLHFGPNVDGYFLPDTAAAIFAAGKQNDVPLLVGWNRDEGGLALPANPPPMDAMRKIARDEFGADAEEFLRLYAAGSPERAARSGAEFYNDRFTAFGAWAWADSQAKTGRQAVYRFRFERGPPAAPGEGVRGAYHSAEIVYVFGAFEAQPQVPWADTDREISALMQSYWVNFACTGNPNGAGLPEWPRYSAGNAWPLMHLDARSVARSDDFRERYLFLDRVWKK